MKKEWLFDTCASYHMTPTETVLSRTDQRTRTKEHANLISGALLEEQGFHVEKSTSNYTIYTPDGDTVTAAVVPGVNIYRVDMD